VSFNHLNDSFYFNYYRIGQGAYRDKVKYFEDNKDGLSMLDEQQLYDVKIDYLLCLFEIGRYEYFLGKVDEMIEVVIIENIFEYDGINIYNELLFKKSACLYNTNNFSSSEKVLKSLGVWQLWKGKVSHLILNMENKANSIKMNSRPSLML